MNEHVKKMRAAGDCTFTMKSLTGSAPFEPSEARNQTDLMHGGGDYRGHHGDTNRRCSSQQ